jgi:hypothetical protein
LWPYLDRLKIRRRDLRDVSFDTSRAVRKGCHRARAALQDQSSWTRRVLMVGRVPGQMDDLRRRDKERILIFRLNTARTRSPLTRHSLPLRPPPRHPSITSGCRPALSFCHRGPCCLLGCSRVCVELHEVVASTRSLELATDRLSVVGAEGPEFSSRRSGTGTSLRPYPCLSCRKGIGRIPITSRGAFVTVRLTRTRTPLSERDLAPGCRPKSK